MREEHHHHFDRPLVLRPKGEVLSAGFGGDQWRPFIHVDDAAEAILTCLEAPLHAVKGQTFNVGCDDQNYQIAQLGDLVKELIPDV